MADEEHLARLRNGPKAWNEWRENNLDITFPTLSHADLRGMDLCDANLRSADLGDANLNSANLLRADLLFARLSGANLSRADLGRAALTEANLKGANLEGANLVRADLNRADLSDANLSGANLTYANLSAAYLMRADLRGADFSGANLSGANLSAADLSGANLVSATLNDSNLSDADLSEARLSWTVLGKIDLSQAKGLESVVHHGPSTIGINTIYRSKGIIPEVFLRGAGVPESFMVYMKSLTVNPVEFYSCFISYSTKNTDFAERLYADLQAKEVRCWFAPHDMQAGKKIHEQIDEALRVHERLLVILSPDSMNSEWVKTEIAKARKREVQQKRRVLFPLRLVPFEVIQDWECFDADMGKDSAGEIREYFIPDFSNWKNHDAYQKAFAQLMRDLKA